MDLATEGIRVAILIGRGTGPHIGMLRRIIAARLFVGEVCILRVFGAEDLLASL